MTKRLSIFIALLLWAFLSGAQSPILFNRLADDELVGGDMLIYEDEKGNKTIEDIISNPNYFIPNINPVPRYFIADNVVWLKTDIRVETEDPVFLYFDYPLIDSVEMFVVGEKGTVVQHKTSGLLVPLDKRDLMGNYIKFKLHKGLYTYYIRAKNTNTLLLPIKLQSFETLYASRSNNNVWQGFFVGLAFLVVAFNIFLWYLFRTKTYILFILYVLATTVLVLHLKGYTYLLFWPQSPVFNQYEASILALSLFAIPFSVTFLETTHRQAPLYKLQWAIMVGFLLVFPIDFAGFHTIAYQWVYLVGIAACLSLCVASIIAYVNRYNAARFFSIAWLVLLVGLLIHFLHKLGVLGYGAFTANSFQIALAINYVLLLFALIDRIIVICQEQTRAKEETYSKVKEAEELVRQQNALLSLKVEERSREMVRQTQTLKEQKSQLEELNKTKDKIFSVIAHDLRGPLGNVSQLADMMGYDENLRNEETIELLKDASKRSFDLLDSLLHWAKAQFGDSEYQRSKLVLRDLADNTLKLYNLKATAKEIKVTNNVPDDLMANADINMIDTVIRNLVSNALKFTVVGGTIEMGGRKDEESETVIFWVKDSGLGINKEKLATIFEAGKNKSVLGTDGETGSGLGLVICKDFVEKNDGTIAAHSDPSRGSTFTITLPAYKG